MSGILDDIRAEFSKTNNALVKLILINIIIFMGLLLVELLLHFSSNVAIYDTVLKQLGLSANLGTFLLKPWTLFTNFFIHKNIWHIAFNMLFLYWFGQLIEEYLGSKRLVSLFVLGGVVGGLAYLLIYNLLPYFAASVNNSMLLGASGGIFAIIVGAATLLPDYTFFIFLLGPVRLKYIAAFYVVLSMIELMGGNPGGNLAHLAGAGVGYGFIKALRRGNDWGAPIVAIMEMWERIFSKKPIKPQKLSERAKQATTASVFKQSVFGNSSTRTGNPNQEEIDSLLDKISKSGYDSLTREEKQTLYRASQQD